MGNLTKCINRVLILIDNIWNYDEVSLLCNKTEFAVFNIKNITVKYCRLVSEEEIAKAREVLTEQKLRAQEMLNFCKLFLENIDNASLAKWQNRAMYQFLETSKFNVKISKKKKNKAEGSVRPKYSSKSSKSSSSSCNTSVKFNESL